MASTLQWSEDILLIIWQYVRADLHRRLVLRDISFTLRWSRLRPTRSYILYYAHLIEKEYEREYGRLKFYDVESGCYGDTTNKQAYQVLEDWVVEHVYGHAHDGSPRRFESKWPSLCSPWYTVKAIGRNPTKENLQKWNTIETVWKGLDLTLFVAPLTI